MLYDSKHIYIFHCQYKSDLVYRITLCDFVEQKNREMAFDLKMYDFYRRNADESQWDGWRLTNL